MGIELRHQIQEFLNLNTIKPDEIRKLLNAKADAVDFINLKANKVDKDQLKDDVSERKVRSKQFEHMLIIMIEMIRNNIKTMYKVDNTIANDLKYMLKQALTVYFWVTGDK